MMKAPRQLPVNDKIVFDIITVFYSPFTVENPALNEGQNIHKNRVPITAKVIDYLLVDGFI